MAYKNPQDRPKQVNKPVGSKPFKARMERQRARRAVDRTGTDANKNGKADRREGKDVSHVKALSKGGKNKDGIRIESRNKNRSRNYKKTAKAGGPVTRNTVKKPVRKTTRRSR
jgi:hypothetical protein|tara:strand:- start:8539 stop:8877 length:339 start_codon:yes stop_codon:yes gene_type:complete